MKAQLEDTKAELESKLKEAEQRLENARVGGNTQAAQAANQDVEDLRMQLNEMAEENMNLVGEYQHLTSQLALLYRASPNEATSRIPLVWPTTPSVDAYFDLILLLTPLVPLLKINRPFDDAVQRKMKAIVHPDGQILSDFLSKEQKTALSQVLNSSLTSLNQNLSRSEENRLSKKWEERKTQYIYSLAPVSDQIPGFVFQQAIDFALESSNPAPPTITESSAILDFNNIGIVNTEGNN